LPADLQAKIIDTLRKSVSAPEARAVWASQGAEFADLAAGAFGGYVKLEVQQWAKVVKAAGGVKPD